VAKFGVNMKDLVDIMKENEIEYYGVSKKIIKKANYNMFKLGERTIMPTYIKKESK
tara:strand:- start:8993 stop:9160 length:168 start_codon:yes stop_codon:yes gene_type:complete